MIQENSIDNSGRRGGRRESRKQNYDPRAKNSLQQKLKKKVLVKKKKNSVMGMKSSARPHVIVKRLGLAAEVVPYIPPEERQRADKGGLQVLYVSPGERQDRGKPGTDRRRRRGWNRRQRFLELPRKASRRQDREGERRSGQEEAELPTTRLLGKVKVGQVGQVGRRGRMLRRRKVGRRRKRKSWYQTTFL